MKNRQKKSEITFVMLKMYPLFKKVKKNNYGGADIQIFNLINELLNYNAFNINAIVGDYNQEFVEQYNSLRLIKSYRESDNFFKKCFKFIRSIKETINSSVYIFRKLNAGTGIATIILKTFGKKIIYMVASDYETDDGFRKDFGVIKSSLANLTFKFADIIITQNRYQKINLKKNMNVNSILIYSSYKITDPKKVKKRNILWVGRSEYFKRPEIFLELAKSLPNERFIMICPPSNPNPLLSKKMKQSSKGIKNLKFISFVPFNKIDEYFKNAKIFIITSTREGFANTIIQSAKNRTPILSLNVNPDEVITKNNFGFFCRDNLSLLKEKLNLLISNPKLYRSLSDNAFKYAKENHDIHRNIKKFINIINKVQKK